MYKNSRRSRYQTVSLRSILLMASALLAASCSSSTSGEPQEGRTSQQITSSSQTGTTGLTPPFANLSSTNTAIAQTTSSAESSVTSSASSSTMVSSVTTKASTGNPDIKLIQEQLVELGYWLGEIDGQVGSLTTHAVVAFQKYERLPRTGVLNSETINAIKIGERPTAQNSSQSGFEIDLERQIGLVIADGRVQWVLDISTGTSRTPTPVGDFKVVREIDGLRVAPLGELYRPKYFNGGIAVHGSRSVPSQPASHGCVRVTFAAMDMVWSSEYLSIGKRVTVY